MLRTGASRSIFRSLNTTSRISAPPGRQQLRSQLCTASHRPQLQTFAKPLVPRTQIVARWASGKRDTELKIDHKREDEIAHKKLKATPESVSIDSTTAQGADAASTAAAKDEDPQMMFAIYSDLVCETEGWRVFGLRANICIASHPRYFQPRGSPKASLLHGSCRCCSIRSNGFEHGVLRMGDQPLRRVWHWLLDERTDG